MSGSKTKEIYIFSFNFTVGTSTRQPFKYTTTSEKFETLVASTR